MRTRSQANGSFWDDEIGLRALLERKMDSNAWTANHVSDVTRILGLSPCPSRVKSIRTAQIAQALLRIGQWEELMDEMADSGTKFPNQDRNSSLITQQTINANSLTPDTCLLLYTDALRLRAERERDLRLGQEAAQNEADGFIANRLDRNALVPEDDDELEGIDNRPGQAQQMAMLQEDADAYVANDNRPEVDADQIRAWGEDPNEHPDLNLEYNEIRRQGRSHDYALKECRTSSLRKLSALWKEAVFPNNANPVRDISGLNHDIIVQQIRTKLREQNWLRKFIFPQGIPNAHGPEQAAARREGERSRGDKAAISSKAEREANNGCLSKAQQILLNSKKAVRPSQNAVDSKFGIDKLLKDDMTDREKFSYTYDSTAERTTLLIDAEDVRRHVEGLRWNAAAGASGMTNKELMALIVGPEGTDNLDGIASLLNIILRGWLDHDDMILLNKCKGVALDKGNHAQDEMNIRPICIGESIMSVANSYVLGKIADKLSKLAGVDSGYQIGLTRDGILCQNKKMQIRFEIDTATDAQTHIVFKIDVRNAFNELSRVAIRRFLKSKLGMAWPNYLIQQYSIDADVDFGNGTRTQMRTGTQQGCKTSAHLFDAVVHSHLECNNLFTDFSDCEINAIHDDTIFRAPVTRALDLFRRIIELYKELGLEINQNKTQVLFRGDTQNIENVRGLQGLTQITENISNSGMIFGGIPFGYDGYVLEHVISKVNEYEQLANKLRLNSTGKNIGTIFSIVRFCLSAKWPYLMRALPGEIWNFPYQGTTIGKYIDSISLRTILEHMDITQFRQDLTESELDSLHTRLGLRLKNGGLGVHTVHDYCDSAMIGMWASNVDQIISSLGQLTQAEKEELKVTNTVIRVKEAAKIMKTKFEHVNAFSQQQAVDIGLKTGDTSTMDILTRLINHAAIEKEDRQALRGGKHQGKLRSALNMYNANRLTEKMAENIDNVADWKDDPYLRAFVAQRSPIANRWLNRLHLDKKARYLTSALVKIAFWNTAGINLIVENRDCKHCAVKLVNWFEHGQVCKKSRKRKQLDNQIKYYTRSWPLHKDIEKLLVEILAKIPDVSFAGLNPKILDTFQMNPDNPHTAPARARAEVDEEDEPAQPDGTIIAIGNGIVVRVVGAHYGDLKIICTFPGDIRREMIIDVTVAGTHAISNHKHTINEDKYSAGLADHAADLKDKKHAHYLHDGNAIGFALDSMGGISKAAMNFTNLIFAKGEDDRKRRWDSESMRIAIKKQFLDRLSSVICHHRALDFIFLGIPNRRLDLAQAQARAQAQAQAQAQVQAQIPAFLAEAYADAEAHAQVQEPQEHAGEVQVGNVNSANSPAVVS